MQEHVARKVDSVYEAMKRKLEHLEQRIDLNMIKSQVDYTYSKHAKYTQGVELDKIRHKNVDHRRMEII